MIRRTLRLRPLCFVFITIYSILSILLLYVHFYGQMPSLRPNGQRTCKMTFTTALCGKTPKNKYVYKNWTRVDGGNNFKFTQVLVTIKSIVLMSKFYKVQDHDTKHDPLPDTDTDCIEFIIFSDSKATVNLLQSLLNQDESWGLVYRHLIHLTYLPVKYPPGFEDLYEMYRPCSTVKLFLPLMLPNLTSTLYLDTDTIFLVNPKKIWRGFDSFSETNWAGMAPDQYVNGSHGYNEFYGNLGLNSGVILFNLTRMRESQFLGQIRSTITKFWKVIKGDQDIFNIYFHYHPEEVKELSCSQNFMYFSCSDSWEPWACNDYSEIEVLHGAGLSFLTEDEDGPFLRGIFQCFKKTSLILTNSATDLHDQLTQCIANVKLISNSSCSRYLETKNIIHIKPS